MLVLLFVMLVFVLCYPRAHRGCRLCVKFSRSVVKACFRMDSPDQALSRLSEEFSSQSPSALIKKGKPLTHAEKGVLVGYMDMFSHVPRVLLENNRIVHSRNCTFSLEDAGVSEPDVPQSTFTEALRDKFAELTEDAPAKQKTVKKESDQEGDDVTTISGTAGEEPHDERQGGTGYR